MKITNEYGLPTQLVDAVSTEYRYKPKQYSVTSLLRGVCETILMRRHADRIVQDVSDMAWAIFGTAVHKVIEDAKEADDELKEEYLRVEHPSGYVLSGRFDSYNDSEKCVTDWKTGSCWKVIYDEWDDYRMQLLIYCWMLRKIGFEADKGRIVMLIKDHSKRKAKFDKSYPQHPIFVKEFEFTGEDFETVEAWLDWRFNQIAECEELPDCELPTCSVEERWAKPEKWAVMRKGRKKAVKLYEKEDEAIRRVETENRLCGEDSFYVEHRPGEDGKCAEYCSVSAWCPYWSAKEGL